MVGIVGHLGLDVHCGVVGNIQAFHVCAPGSIPGNGIFSQSSLWLKSSCSMHPSIHPSIHPCLVTGLVVLSVALGLASSSSHFWKVSLLSHLILSYLILSYLKLRKEIKGRSCIKRQGSCVKVVSIVNTHTLSLSLCEASLGKSVMSITLVSVSMSHQVKHHHHHHHHHQSSSSALYSI